MRLKPIRWFAVKLCKLSQTPHAKVCTQHDTTQNNNNKFDSKLFVINGLNQRNPIDGGDVDDGSC